MDNHGDIHPNDSAKIPKSIMIIHLLISPFALLSNNTQTITAVIENVSNIEHINQSFDIAKIWGLLKSNKDLINFGLSE